MFTSLLNNVEGSLTIQNALLCALVSLALGFVIAFLYGMQGVCSRNFMITLVLLPVLVQMVIMLVNGNLGTSVAVLGAFSLVRFCSRFFKGDGGYLLCHGDWSGHRNGILRLRCRDDSCDRKRVSGA